MASRETPLSIADAVVTELNGHAFSQGFTATRAVLPSYTLADLEDLTITVVPKGVEISKATRARFANDIQVDIGVQKKIETNAETEAVALLPLVDEIVAFMSGRALEGAPGASWVAIENDPIYSPSHLVSQRVFMSVVTCTYRVQQ